MHVHTNCGINSGTELRNLRGLYLCSPIVSVGGGICCFNNGKMLACEKFAVGGFYSLNTRRHAGYYSTCMPKL